MSNDDEFIYDNTVNELQNFEFANNATYTLISSRNKKTA